MNEYIDLFIDKEYPKFIDKYLNTKTLERLKYITQFCGCDYTKLYSPRFLYTRFDHSVAVAHMTWHFTHDLKETLVALLHDIGTPCFAHCIDYVFGDYIEQESSEKSLVEMLQKDDQIQKYLQEDGLSLEDFKDFSNYHILENKSPRLCTDRLDGVLHTCYVWLHTHTIDEIKEVYDDMAILENEDGLPEIGFKTANAANKFASMVSNYAKELQGNRDKYVMKYISDIIKLSVERHLLTLDDLYTKKEEDICEILNANFSSWQKFNNAESLIKTDTMPKNSFFVSIEVKKRNTIPLVYTSNKSKRIIDVSEYAKKCYKDIEDYKDTKYAYIEEIENLS